MPSHRLLPILALALLTGCSPWYVVRAGIEEAKLLWRRQPIERVLSDGARSDADKAKLEIVLAARQFAAETLGLRVGGSYSSVAEVDEGQLVFVVTAAERLRLQPHTWWFPIVGRVPYKGYFERTEAEAEATALEAQGLDTLVRPSVAFSTLGWFDDPLPTTLLRYDEVGLANTILHELLHNTRYFPGEAAFAESFANFVGGRGAIEFFRRRGDAARAAQADAEWSADLRYSEFLGEVIARLRQQYEQGVTLERRSELFKEAIADAERQGIRERAFRGGALNNAILLHEVLYFDRLTGFEHIYQRHNGDLRATIDAILNATNDGGNPFAALANLAADPD